MRYAEKCRLLKAEWDDYSDGLCRTCAPIAPAHRANSHLWKEWRTPFREPLQFIVMSVMSGAFPDTNGVFYMTVD
jgi:hypothetical protein